MADGILTIAERSLFALTKYARFSHEKYSIRVSKDLK
jgi:hypothetical protein